MQLIQQQTLPVSQARAWEALNDIALLQRCIAGCESIVETGPNAYDAVVVASVGPVKARFKGRLRLEDLQPPNAYTLHFEGQGGPAGHGKGSARIVLDARGENQTVLRYDVKASVGGKLAQIGSRLIDMAAQKMATDFFDKFTAELTPPAPPVEDAATDEAAMASGDATAVLASDAAAEPHTAQARGAAAAASPYTLPAARHLSLLGQAVLVWFAFWLLGLPRYYQQYSTVAVAIGSIVLSVLISLAAVAVLARGSDATRMPRAVWVSIYYTLPFAVLDYAYCGWYLGLGAGYLSTYWYLAIFYLTPWLTFPPTAWLLNGKGLDRRK